MNGAKLQPVAPDSVHVWRGYRTPSKNYDEFAAFLGTVFVPACTLLQPNAGLNAYVPSMPSPINKPETVPDQTALMFWTKPDAHTNGFEVVAVRTYTNLHSLVYAHNSKSQFPIALPASLQFEQPYYLINQPADWMHGTIHHFVGAKKPDVSSTDFLHQLQVWAAAYKSNVPSNMDGALLCAGENYVVFWEHSPNENAKSSSAFNELKTMSNAFLEESAKNYSIPGGLWTSWPGIDLSINTCLNMQLIRPILL